MEYICKIYTYKKFLKIIVFLKKGFIPKCFLNIYLHIFEPSHIVMSSLVYFDYQLHVPFISHFCIAIEPFKYM